MRAKVLDIDTVHNRLSLGLKASYFDSNMDTDGNAAEVSLSCFSAIMTWQ